jgi:hypothetical protein
MSDVVATAFVAEGPSPRAFTIDQPGMFKIGIVIDGTEEGIVASGDLTGVLGGGGQVGVAGRGDIGVEGMGTGIGVFARGPVGAMVTGTGATSVGVQVDGATAIVAAGKKVAVDAVATQAKSVGVRASASGWGVRAKSDRVGVEAIVDVGVDVIAGSTGVRIGTQTGDRGDPSPKKGVEVEAIETGIEVTVSADLAQGVLAEAPGSNAVGVTGNGGSAGVLGVGGLSGVQAVGKNAGLIATGIMGGSVGVSAYGEQTGVVGQGGEVGVVARGTTMGIDASATSIGVQGVGRIGIYGRGLAFGYGASFIAPRGIPIHLEPAIAGTTPPTSASRGDFWVEHANANGGLWFCVVSGDGTKSNAVWKEVALV